MNSDHSTAGPRPKQGLSRREEYAQVTRQAIVDAARRLFSEKGYFSTKVEEIAALARVAPATVYAVSAGKQGLLTTSSIVSTLGAPGASVYSATKAAVDAATRSLGKELGSRMIRVNSINLAW